MSRRTSRQPPVAKQRSGIEHADAVCMRARYADPSPDLLNTNLHEALNSNHYANTRDMRDIAEDRATTQIAIRLIKDVGLGSFDKSVDTPRENTRSW